MTHRLNRFLPALLLTLLCLAPQRVDAAMVFCNRTQSPIESAFGYRESVQWISEGWWQIEPGQCSRVFGRPLTQRFYFYYAKSLAQPTKNKPPLVWSGKYELCADTKAFHIEGDEECQTRGYYVQGFEEVDIGANAHNYTLDFKDNDSSH